MEAAGVGGAVFGELERLDSAGELGELGASREVPRPFREAALVFRRGIFTSTLPFLKLMNVSGCLV